MKKRKVWFWLMTVSSVIYIVWRLFFTIPTKMGVVSLVAGIILFAAELIGVIEAVVHNIAMSHENEPKMPTVLPQDYPDVDVLIATHSEEPDLLFKTINGCKHMDYPDKSKVHIYICDDGNRPEVAKLAKDMKVGYFALEDNKLAKAGNLNNAISKTNSPLVATFDADMIPRSNFLLETVPYFSLPMMIEEDGVWRKRTDDEIDPDYKIGFIQTPQSFYNPDLFQFNFFAEKNIPNEQDYFFKEVNVGRNRTNSAIYAGSNTVISREALEEVGGIRTKTITEDFATGIDIQSKGYKCYAIKKVLASGLSPDDFPNLLKQRQRWGRGCVQTIFRFKFLFNGLPILSKLSYFSCLLYWWTFMRRIIYILAPILYTVFGVLVVKTDVIGILFIWLPYYLIYNHSLKVLSGKVRNQRWSNIVDTILSPYMIFPILAESLGFKMRKFSVTNKEKTVTRSAKIIYAIPHIVLFAATLVGIYFSIKYMVLYKSILGIVVLYWLCMNAYFLGAAIFFMTGRINYRSAQRFYAEIPVSFYVGTHKVNAMTCDISENGFAFKTEFPEFLAGNCKFALVDGRWKSNVEGQIVHVAKVDDKWRYSVKLNPLDFDEKQKYDQIVYDRFPTLSDEIKTSVLTELVVFFKSKTDKTVQSNRKLPRIPIDLAFQTENGEKVKVVDYNYHYITIDGDVPAPSFSLKFGNALLFVKKVDDDKIENQNLYEVENWREISSSNEIRAELETIMGLNSVKV